MIYVVYRDPLGVIADISQYVNLADPSKFSFTMNAEQGAVGTSNFQVEDPDDSLELGGLRLVNVYDDLAPFIIVYSGYADERTISRDVFRAGPQARVWDVSVSDVNSVLYRHVLTMDAANRPAETDVERLQWLDSLSFAFIGNTTYLSTANPVDMDAVDYRGQFTSDVIDDCSQQSGKNWYLHVVFTGTAYEQGIWYGAASLPIYDSTARISNVLTDVDSSTTWAASLDSKLVRDPSRVFSGVYMPYDGGWVYRTRPATATAFALGGRDTVTPSVNVKTAAKATVRADRMLVDISTEEDIITTSIVVPSYNVNDIRQGMRVEAKFSHFPGYEDFTWMRVLNRTVTLLSPPDVTGSSIWQVGLTLSPATGTTPSSCTTVVASMQTDDSGANYDLSAYFPPVSWSTIDDPAVYPSVVIGFMGFANQAAAFANGGSNLTGAFTKMADSRTGDCAYVGSYSTLAITGYKALTSGSPGSMTATWSSSNPIGWRGIAAYLPTSATSPVQEASQCDSGGTTTLDSPPTAGNILILCRFFEVSGPGPPNPPTGYVTIKSYVGFRGGLGPSETMFMDICARCVQDGDTAAQPTGNSSFSHWSFLSEWAIT